MFLPTNYQEVSEYGLDFVMISCDAYVDHPTFGHALISRYIESKGFTIGIIPQPLTENDYFALPTPNKAYLVSGSVVDSMINNYTVSKKKRKLDVYSPKSKMGKRPDRQVTVICKMLKKLFPDVPVIIGGIEPSLRRLAHYDYWADKIMPSLLMDTKADILIYGMGEKPFSDILKLINKNVPINKIKDVRGTCVIVSRDEAEKDKLNGGCIEVPSYLSCLSDKKQYAKSFSIESKNTDSISGVTIFQKQTEKCIVKQNPPAFSLSVDEMDQIYKLPFMRTYHPMYESEGGIKAIEEVQNSIVSHRGCFGSCSFCALNYHQGRRIQKRSDDSIIDEAVELTKTKGFKGYINDLSGPSANFRESACQKQETLGVCKDKYCIGHEPCKNLKVDHSKFIALLRKLRQIKGIKKVFIRSGIRYDYMLYDKECDKVLEELIEHHISGQLKVAPEHMSDKVLKVMNKPSFSVYQKFADKYKLINKKMGKEQFLVPYLISSHPGCGLKEAVDLTEYLKSIHYMPEQVQDFYPTPSTRSTCIYYTGIDPDTMQEVFVERSKEGKQMQRSLLQYRKVENREIVAKAYKMIGSNQNNVSLSSKNTTKSNKNSKTGVNNFENRKKYGKIEIGKNVSKRGKKQ